MEILAEESQPERRREEMAQIQPASTLERFMTKAEMRERLEEQKYWTEEEKEEWYRRNVLRELTRSA
ncbi:MAG: hypothetical protein ABI977_26205 [Acidobacteriota bacterium]